MRKNILIILYSVIILILLIIGYKLIEKEEKPMDNFSKSSLSEKLKQEMITKNIWNTKCPVALERLQLLKVSYIDFEGIEHHNGKIIVHDVVADHVINIFRELFENKFPIASINLINDYAGNDELSMENNNTSSFNCRNIENSNLPSLHAYGLAIDINPQQNPYLITKYESGKKNIPVYPSLGIEYINRKNIRTGMVETVLNEKTRETIIDIFYKYGFTIWGGNWNDPIDWHHFQLSREQAEMIATLSYEKGLELFAKTANNYLSK